jgi:hypothetical protein
MAELTPADGRGSQRARKDEPDFSDLFPQILPRSAQRPEDQLVLTPNVVVNGHDSATTIKQAHTAGDTVTLLTVVGQLAGTEQHAGVLNNKGCAFAFLADFKNARQAFAAARRAPKDWPAGQSSAKEVARANIAIVDDILANP